MEHELIRISLAVAACALGAYYDIKNNRNVPNWVTYSFVAIGVFINAIPFDLSFILPVFAVSALIFIVGYLFYRLGQIGGADVLLFTGVSLALPYPPSHLSSTLFEYPFILPVFVVSGVLFSIAMLIAYVPRIFADVRARKVKTSPYGVLLSLIMLLAYTAVIYMLAQILPLRPLQILILVIVVFSAVFFMLFREHITENYVIEYVSLEEVDEEDVLALEKIDSKTISQYSLKRLLTASEIERLKRTPVAKMRLPVCKNMPMFAPYLLLSLLINLVIDPSLLFAPAF
ncbi:MAG: prepilin peptidase [Candidatus Micrarchaeia archaeon]